MSKPRDLYEILEVKTNASDGEIKKAYRRLARKFHPDVNPGDASAEERFKEVSAAFEILSDPEKRKLYDELGHDAAKIGWDPDKAAGYRQWRAGQQGAGGFGFGFEDLFGDLFGRSGFGDVRSRGGGPESGEDLGARVEITFAQAMQGVEITVPIERPGQCSDCSGSGVRAGSGQASCPDCQGTGRVQQSRGPISFARTCRRCGGRGVVRGDPCTRCSGAGVVGTSARLNVKVPAGIRDGGKVRLPGQGASGRRGGPSGDLYIEVLVRPHPHFRREGDDLRIELPVTVGEAVGGATVTLPTFDGPVRLKVPAGSQSGQSLRLRGKGAPHLRGRGRGDLYAELKVVVPTGAEARDLAGKLDELYDKPVREDLSL